MIVSIARLLPRRSDAIFRRSEDRAREDRKIGRSRKRRSEDRRPIFRRSDAIFRRSEDRVRDASPHATQLQVCSGPLAHPSPTSPYRLTRDHVRKSENLTGSTGLVSWATLVLVGRVLLHSFCEKMGKHRCRKRRARGVHIPLHRALATGDAAGRLRTSEPRSERARCAHSRARGLRRFFLLSRNDLPKKPPHFRELLVFGQRRIQHLLRQIGDPTARRHSW